MAHRSIDSTAVRATLYVFAGILVAACGGGGSSSGGGDSSGGDDESADSAGSLQQQAVDNGQVQYASGDNLSTFSISGTTFAVDTGGRSPNGSPPAGIEATDYFGAVNPDGARPVWWEGWTAHFPNTGNLRQQEVHPLKDDIRDGSIEPASTPDCRGIDPDLNSAPATFVRVFGVQFPLCVIEGDDLDNGDGSVVTLTNDHVYALKDLVHVGNGNGANATPASVNEVTLEIEKGTMIAGDSVGTTESGLIISRGSDIRIQGTRDKPVIMQSASFKYDSGTLVGFLDAEALEDLDSTYWEGLSIRGFAPTSVSDTSRYGGSKENDNSGDIDHLVISTADLSLKGTGSETTVSHAQVVPVPGTTGAVEMVGGQASLDHFVIAEARGEAARVGWGYSGTMQHGLIRMSGGQGAALRVLNSPENADASPTTSPRIANLTILGKPHSIATDLEDRTTAALHEDGTTGSFYGVVYSDDMPAGESFTNGCIDVDDMLDSGLSYRSSLFHCSPENVSAADE